ncbi:HRDC domain-containing protein [Bacillus paralicheniformis]|uniref:HRDC domain-containing protein n=1 Tax=Bacillus paralicheniformis TaxID=1648923 RepID=UPI0021A55141|nr:HRDC domain-containing protein [Bacillus paralicheniformis]UWS61876.1 HRDC domain-containing protein [Bacillus paralicheniformis]
MPPYIVFNDSTLREMAERMPTTEAEMMLVKGIGEAKLKQFGEPFMAFFRQREEESVRLDAQEEWA